MPQSNTRQFTATYKKEGTWYLGWIEEIPGVNTQGKTLKEVRENLQEALELVLETNRMLIRRAFPHGRMIRESIFASFA
mgnify:CR=1 FL=1